MDYVAIATNVVIAGAILIAGWVLGNQAKNVIQKVKKLDSTLKTFLGGMAKYAIFHSVFGYGLATIRHTNGELACHYWCRRPGHWPCPTRNIKQRRRWRYASDPTPVQRW